MIKIGDWLSEGWALIKDDILTFAVATLLAGVIGSITLFICMPAMTVGLFMMMFKKLRGETVAIGDVFQGFSKFGPAFVAFIVVGIAGGLVAFILQFIPILGQIASLVLVLVIGGAMFYLAQIIAATDMGGIEAIKASWEKTKPDVVMYSVTYLVYSIVISVGAIACGIGQLVTSPLAMAAMAIAYRDNFSLPGAAPAAPAGPADVPPPAAPPPAAPPPEPPKPEGSDTTPPPPMPGQ